MDTLNLSRAISSFKFDLKPKISEKCPVSIISIDVDINCDHGKRVINLLVASDSYILCLCKSSYSHAKLQWPLNYVYQTECQLLFFAEPTFRFTSCKRSLNESWKLQVHVISGTVSGPNIVLTSQLSAAAMPWFLHVRKLRVHFSVGLHEYNFHQVR